MPLKHTKCYNQLTEIILCPQHKHLDGLNVFQREESMWKMSLAADK
jgi:hypothetical protein